MNNFSTIFYCKFKRKNPNLKIRDSVGRIPLMNVVKRGTIEMVQILLSISNDCNVLDTLNNSPLFYAIENTQNDAK